MAILAGLYIFLFLRRIFRFYTKGHSKVFLKVFNILLALAGGFLCLNIWSTAAMILLHLIILSLLLDIAAFFIRKMFHNKKEEKFYRISQKIYGCGMIPIFICCVIFAYGFINMTYINRTEYLIETEKELSEYKIVLITDTHYATIQDTNLLKNAVKEISEEYPDIVLLAGDIVEEGTSKEKMQEVFAVFGSLKSRFGVYYVYGNHDCQPYTDYPAYTKLELIQTITENGITILEDNYTEINQELILAGRADAAWGNSSGRASSEQILNGVDHNKYIIMADHQPIGTEENNAAGVDLELSGHTHAGQIFPVGCLTELTGGLNYGKYQEGNCKIIVSSGFTGWGYPIRTQGHCEYVVVTVQGRK